MTPADRELAAIRRGIDAALALAEESRERGDIEAATAAISTALLLSRLETIIIRAVAYVAAAEAQARILHERLS